MVELLTEAAKTTLETEVRKRTRGRPRTREYIRVSVLLANFVEQKRKYEEAKHIVAALQKATQSKLEVTGSGVYYERLGGPDGETMKAKVKGEKFVCMTCGKGDVNPEVCYDLGHDPPRLCLNLQCGHRLDLVIRQPKPTKCPKCEGQLMSDTVDVFCVLCSYKMPLAYFGE